MPKPHACFCSLNCQSGCRLQMTADELWQDDPRDLDGEAHARAYAELARRTEERIQRGD